MLTKIQRQALLDRIKHYEAKTSGIIHVHVRKKCKESVIKDAEKYFVKRRLNQTRHRNAVLIFIGEKSQRFAVIGDKAIHEHVQQAFWDNSRDILATHFKQGQYVEGITGAIEEIGKRLEKHFPKDKIEAVNDTDDEVTED